jgi:hypothetical protein
LKGIDVDVEVDEVEVEEAVKELPTKEVELLSSSDSKRRELG